MDSTYKYAYVIAAVYAIAILAIFPKWTVVDAYITFRYADNWARYAELTWNVGEDRIEGYTGFALPMILGVLIRSGVDPVAGSQTIGALSFLAGGLILYLLMRKIDVGEPIRCVVVLLYFTAPSFYIHAYSGLETMLFGTTILACLYVLLVCLIESRHQALHESLLCVLLLFAGLVRPEGVILAATSLVVLGFVTLKYRRKPWRFFVRASLLCILPSLAYFLWRWNYYGQLLPNTFYAKSFDGVINSASVWQLRRFLLTYMVIPLAAVAVLFAGDLVRIGETIKQRSHAAPAFAIAYGAVAAFMVLATLKYLNSTLIMIFSFRFFVPFLPVLLAGVAFLLNVGTIVLVVARTEKPMKFRVVRALLVALLAGQLFLHFYRLGPEIAFAADYRQLINDEHIPTALFVQENTPPGEWLVVLNEAGVIPFLTRLKTVDFGRLNDETLARGLPEEEKADYFYSFNPGAAVITSLDWEEVLSEPQTYLITSDPRFERYTLVRRPQMPAVPHQNFYLFVFLRQDLLGGSE